MTTGDTVQLPCPATLIGRAAEWSTAMRALDAARRGSQIALLITGPLGIGKSRLLTELGATAARLGFRRATPGETAVAATPTVYLVDDLHAAGAGLTRPFAHSLHTPAGQPVLWMVATQRRLYQATGLERYLSLCADASVEVRLEPLDGPATVALARDVLGAEPDDDLSVLLRSAGGNPYLIISLVEGLRTEGGLRRHDHRVGLRDAAVVPTRAREAVEEFLGVLTPPARHALCTAARLGTRVSPRQLGGALAVTMAPLLPDAVDELVGAGLLRAEGGHLAFQHPLVHAYLCGPGAADEPPAAPPALRCRQSDRPWERLTRNERAIADMAAQGLTNTQIARRIGRSAHTVNFHLRKVFQKLGVRSRVELARIRAEMLELTLPA